MPQKIESLEQLKALCAQADEGSPVETFIMLNGGVRSSKDITNWPEGVDAEPGGELDPDFPDISTDVFNEHGLVDEGASREGLQVHWMVFHSIDDTSAEYTDDAALLGQTMLGEALEKGALYVY
jgi:hypothetical protein